MTRRVLTVTLAVTILAVIGFGIPLGLAVQRLDRRDAVYGLIRAASQASSQLPTQVEPGDPVELPPGPPHSVVGAYRTDGHRLAGSGPATADLAVLQALSGRVAQADNNGPVVAVPVAANEQIIGVVRASLPDAAVDGRIRRAWLTMAAGGVGAVAVAGVVAYLLASRLARPVAALADAATRIGNGDFSATVHPDRTPEFAAVATALNATAARLDGLLARERAFSADASHQLRTPLTGLRLTLESAQLDSSTTEAAIIDALDEVDRLQSTIEDLVSLARDTVGSTPPFAIADLLAELGPIWHDRLARHGRRLDLKVDPNLPAVRLSAQALRQILAVLTDNAAEHGRGRVTVSAHTVSAAVQLAINDEGLGLASLDGDIFARRPHGTGRRGIGLALARSLAAAEGATLEAVDTQPGTTFRLLIPLSAEQPSR